MSNSDIFNGSGLEITLKSPDDFLKVKETLTRIGVVSSKFSKTLYQSCHILHKTDPVTKQSRYAILHFKEMYKLDGKISTFSEIDKNRRNVIAGLLVQWGLVETIQTLPETEKTSLKVVSFSEKQNWKLIPKYTIGSIK